MSADAYIAARRRTDDTVHQYNELLREIDIRLGWLRDQTDYVVIMQGNKILAESDYRGARRIIQVDDWPTMEAIAAKLKVVRQVKQEEHAAWASLSRQAKQQFPPRHTEHS
jgi:hypothetical protein